jgi:hypothetical protein
MMFVLNELFQENKSATMSFLDRLLTAMRPGSFLLVADSAGDFSQVEIGRKQQTTQEAGAPAAGGDASDGHGNAELEDEEDAEEAEEETDADTPSAAAASASPSSTDTVASLLAAVPSTRAPAPSSSSSSSASSSSAASKPRKKYWIYSLLDAIPSLKILHAVDSEWYRYPGAEKNLKYPLKFENMRYFVRIYQKKA